MTDRIIRVVLEPTNVASGSRQIQTSLDGVNKSAKGANTALSALRTLAGGLAGAFSAREIIQAANTYVNISNQLKTIVNDSADLPALQREVFKQAQETGSEYRAQATLVARIGRANENIGASSGEILKVSKAVAQSFALSGATQEETTAATIQLGQALASGRLQGDELRSVLENNSVLAQSIAKGMGTTVGNLRKLASEGKLTSKDVFGAILKDSETLNERFGDLAPTLSRGAQTLKNQLVETVGQLDAALGASDAFAKALMDAAKIVDEDLTPALIDGAIGFQDFVEQTIGRIDLILNGIRQAFAQINIETAEARKNSSTFDDALKSAAGAAKSVVGWVDELPPILRQIGEVNPVNLIAEGLVDVEENTRDVTVAQRELNEAQKDEANILATLETIRKQAEERAKKRAADRAAGKQGLDPTTQLGPTAKIDTTLSDAQKKAQTDAEKMAEALAEQNAQLKLTMEFSAAAAAEIDRLGANETDAAQIIADFGIQAEEAMRAYEIATLKAKGATEEQVAALLEQSSALAALQQQQREADRDRADAQVVKDLEEQLRVLKLTTEERAVDAELSKISIANREKERAKVTELSQEITKLQKQQAFFEAFNKRIAEGFADAVRGVISDAFNGEFESIQDSFSKLLVNLGQELLTSILQQQIGKLFEGLATSAGGGATGLGGLFGAVAGAFTGRQGGGSVVGGRPVLVGEKRPELFVPPTGGGSIVADAAAALRANGPPALTIINSVDPENQIAAMQTARGREVTRNNIRQQPAFYRQMLGN